MSPETKKRVLQLTEAGTLALASLTFVALLIASGLAASPDADRYGFKNSTGDVSDESSTQVCMMRFLHFHVAGCLPCSARVVLFLRPPPPSPPTGNSCWLYILDMECHLQLAGSLARLCMDFHLPSKSSTHHCHWSLPSICRQLSDQYCMALPLGQ